MKKLSLILLTIVALAGCSTDESSVVNEEPMAAESAPIIACAEETVREELTVSSINIKEDDAWEDLTAQSDGTWTVTGQVTADSTAGGQIESQFTCNKVGFADEAKTQCSAECVYLDPLVKKK